MQIDLVRGRKYRIGGYVEGMLRVYGGYVEGRWNLLKHAVFGGPPGLDLIIQAAGNNGGIGPDQALRLGTVCTIQYKDAPQLAIVFKRAGYQHFT